MKPIVKGCMAVIVSGRYPENIGTVVTVGNFLGRPSPVDEREFYKDDIWEIDKPIRFSLDHTFYLCSESAMQRLGDDPEESDIKQEEELVEGTK